MQGLSLFQHHQIGDVDNGVDGINSGTVEPLLNPLRRVLFPMHSLDRSDAVVAAIKLCLERFLMRCVIERWQ